MSSMELSYGSYRRTHFRFTKDEMDTDEFLEKEDKEGVVYVNVDDVIYEFTSERFLDVNGFTINIPNDGKRRVICYWYNGGASEREVLESTIRENL